MGFQYLAMLNRGVIAMIYIITQYTSDSDYIVGVYSTKELAEAAQKIHEANDYNRWKRWLTEDDIVPTHEEIMVLVDSFVVKEYEVDKEISVVSSTLT